MINAFKIFCGLFITLWMFAICRGQEEPTISIETSLGQLKGSQMESLLGEKFWAFRGVRYAQAPVGDLRFQNPQTGKAWKLQVYDATADGPICPQRTANLSYLSEDCLRLNVYTKDAKAQNPVIVYLHPGGYYSGVAVSRNAGPENFMDRNIVLVTVNYRLGSLGFLVTGTPEAAGNMGLKDQVEALRWIQQHVDKFGGDPNSVTLWGYSAGARSVGLHLMSPMAKGLFHQGIVMSASPVSQFKYKTHQLDLAEKQARLLHCPVKPIKEMVKCLKTKPMMDFVNSTKDMCEVGWNPVLNWKPVIESDCVGDQERFLMEDPYTTGSMHHDELLYLLNIRTRTPQFKWTDRENDIIERLTRFWFQFANKSDPNNAFDDYLKEVKWPLYSHDKKQYLEIGQNLNVKSNGIFPKRFQLWDRLFPITEMLISNNKQ